MESKGEIKKQKAPCKMKSMGQVVTVLHCN